MFKNKIHCSADKPVTIDATIVVAAIAGTVLLQNEDNAVYATDTASVSDAGIVIVKEESPTAGILASVQGVPGVDVVFPAGSVTQVHEVQAGQMYNVRVGTAQATTKGVKYAIGAAGTAVDTAADAETPVKFLIAQETTAAGSDRLVRFKVAFG